jgi:hypothetical protein
MYHHIYAVLFGNRSCTHSMECKPLRASLLAARGHQLHLLHSIDNMLLSIYQCMAIINGDEL